MRLLGGWLTVVLQHGLLDPIRHGRLRTAGLSRPWRTLFRLLQGVLAVSLAVVAAAPWLRGHLELDAAAMRSDSAPAAWGWLPLAIASLAVCLVLTAVLHAPWWAKLLGQAMAAVYYVDLTSKALASDPAATWLTGTVAGLFVAQLALLAWRSWRPPAWWEPLAVWGATVAMLVVTTSPQLHPGIPGDGALLYASWESLVMISVFVLPVVYASAIGAAQVAVGLAESSVTATAARVGRRTLALVSGGLLLAGGIAATAGFVRAGHELPVLGAAAAALLAFGLGWWGLDRLARRRGAGASRLAELEPVFGTALLVGLLVHLHVIAATLARLVLSGAQLAAAALGRPGLAVWAADAERPLSRALGLLDTPVLRIPVVLVMLAAAVWAAGRGRRGPAQLLLGAAVVLSPAALQASYQTALVELIPVAAGLALAVGYVVLAVRRQLTVERATALGIGGLLVLAFHQTGAVSSPLGLLFTGSGALIFGLLWGFLTGSGFANADGRRWPRESRALLVLAQFMLTAAMLVLTALFADPSRAFDTAARDALGATVLGSALLACALAGCLRQAFPAPEHQAPTA